MRSDGQPLAPEEKEAWVHQTFQRISDRYDLMNDLESFGLHRAWKRRLVNAVAELRAQAQPFAVLDVACGTGDIVIALAQALPGAQMTGLDFSENMLDVARRRASGLPGDSVRFVQGNALDLPFADASFDAATIAFGLRNMASYERTIREMARVLRPGSSLFCLEASYPTAPLIKPVFRLYFKYIMPAMATLITRRSAEYRWLNDSTEAFLSKPQLATLMEHCGLTNVRYRSFAFGAAALHQGVRNC
jgi:demethylmenaquinone methyltransferase/2-methoxy-6-polyprenyl-1,4-benzoquinol methylase